MRKSKGGLNMEKLKCSKDLKEKQRYKIVVEEIDRFNNLIKKTQKNLGSYWKPIISLLN